MQKGNFYNYRPNLEMLWRNSRLLLALVYLNYFIYLGIMMTLAWVLFAFVGLFTARYMREVWEPRQLLGEKAWFTVSRVKGTKF